MEHLMINCNICEKPFKPYRSNTKTCNDPACKNEAKKRYERRRNIEKYLSNKHPKKCLHCGKSFTPSRTNRQLHCNLGCALAHKDFLKAERLLKDAEITKRNVNKDLVGYTTGMLTVLSEAGRNRNGNRVWLCKCECGKNKTYSSSHLTRKESPVKSCGCLIKRSGSDSPYWKGHGEISKSWWNNHVVRSAEGSNSSKSTRRPLELTLTIEQAWELFLEQDRKCALSGIPLAVSPTAIYNTASVDRIDSGKGYTLDNVQWVHKDVNKMKNVYSQKYFIDMCKKIANRF